MVGAIWFLWRKGGILAGAFRSGRPDCQSSALPQVGVVYNRVNGSGLFPCADSPLTAGIAGPFYLSARIRARPADRWAGRSDGQQRFARGRRWRNLRRALAIGCFFSGADAPGPERTLLLNCLAWLASAPSLTESAMAETRRMAELEFLRREKIYDYTLNERGPDHGAGIIPAAKNRLESALLSRLFRLDYILPHCPALQRPSCWYAAGIGTGPSRPQGNYEEARGKSTRSRLCPALNSR